jgi:S-adenosylmethionine:tRNA ribosyltransferase-isomerase
MRLADFEYELPAERIAQVPAPGRDAARLLVLDRATGARRHHVFRELPSLLRAGDVLVLNDTKVIPARLLGRWDTGGIVEVLLLREVEPGTWQAMLKPAARARPGRRIAFGEAPRAIQARVAAYAGAGRRVLRFEAGTEVRALMRRHGLVPLPPYIRRPRAQVASPKSKVQSPEGGLGTTDPGLGTEVDRERYQTVYAKEEGAIAAPTAGLHFSEPLLQRLAQTGIEIRWLTLHVGPGTFLPIRSERVEGHRMEPEPYVVPEATAQAIKAARAGRRVVAVGTTVVRTLEHAALRGGDVQAGPGAADLFIVPGHRFRVVDALITNFHLPRSTLLVLVAAFAGLDRIRAAYAEAIAQGYRFYSYGDAMLILDGVRS